LRPRKNIKVIDKPSIDIILNPIKKFLQIQASGGIILLIVTVVSIIWANSPYSKSYSDLLTNKITIGFDNYTIEEPLIVWINEGLMTVFFFLVGLEIKREILIGELSSFKKASLPIFSALGGMIFPALIYLMFNTGTVRQSGWGIPVATDIAFSLGILSLVKSKVSFSIKVFLTAFAIIDDLGAVIIIAFFYTSSISLLNLSIAAIFLVLLLVSNFVHIRNPFIYILLGFGLWVAFFKSGIHPTIAGVVLAFTIPTIARIDTHAFLDSNKDSLKDIEKINSSGQNINTTSELNSAIFEIENSCEKVLAPSHRIEHKLNPYVAYFIIPLFAFANAGVHVNGNFLAALTKPISLGIILGLVFGKQIGITLFSWLACKLNISDLPASTTWKQMYGVACLGGIGFTMSLFISSLAFNYTDYVEEAKIGILCGSFISGIIGLSVLKISGNTSK
jgi:NhaA family Na+:H+ antiporter